jgi:hypothetical protein
MKAKIEILVCISLILASCAPATPTQENEVVEIAKEEIITEAPIAQETITTEEPVSTEKPTDTPTEIPIACVSLLTPVEGVEIPPVGKVTFSWTAVKEAGKYVLNIILPSGDIVPFETDQTFYDRYMEAFVAGGEYKWQVIAQRADGNEICVSEVATFDKPSYEKQKGGSENGGDGGSNNQSPPDIPPPDNQ